MNFSVEDRRALRRVRALLRARRDRPSGGDLAYGFYLGVMLVIIVAAPVARTAVLWLAETMPDSEAGWLFGDSLTPAPAALAVVAAAVVGLPVIGANLSPLRSSLPELDLLWTTGLPRRGFLVGRVVRLFAVGAFGGLACAGLFVVATAIRGTFTSATLWGGLGSGLAAGVLTVVLLIFGQLLHGTRWQSLREEAVRLDAVSTLAMTGDFHTAVGRLGRPVTTGRRWRWRVPRPGFALIPSRDLLGIARTPVRSAAALVGVAGSGSIVGIVSTVVISAVANSSSDASVGTAMLPPIVSAALGAGLLLVCYVSVGPWCRGVRTAGQALGAPALLPYPIAGLVGRHLVAPALLSVGVAGLSAALSAGLSTGISGLVSGHAVLGFAPVSVLIGALFGVLFGLLAVALRLLGALKGPLPQRLLTPVPTPAGDMSGVNILVWNLDGPIWALAIGGSIAAIALLSAGWAILAAVVALALLLLASATRLRARAG